MIVTYCIIGQTESPKDKFSVCITVNKIFMLTLHANISSFNDKKVSEYNSIEKIVNLPSSCHML